MAQFEFDKFIDGDVLDLGGPDVGVEVVGGDGAEGFDGAVWQRFLAEQGYSYRIWDADELL